MNRRTFLASAFGAATARILPAPPTATAMAIRVKEWAFVEQFYYGPPIIDSSQPPK